MCSKNTGREDFIKMREISPNIILREIALTQKIMNLDSIRCSHCKNWAYNNGGIMTSVYTSRCRVCKHKTVGNQFCKKFCNTLDK